MPDCCTVHAQLGRPSLAWAHTCPSATRSALLTLSSSSFAARAAADTVDSHTADFDKPPRVVVEAASLSARAANTVDSHTAEFDKPLRVVEAASLSQHIDTCCQVDR